MRLRSLALPAVALVLGGTACSGDYDVAAGGTPTTLPSVSSSAAPPTGTAPPGTPAPAPEAARNERGNIPLQVGERVAVRASDAPDAPTVLTFALEEFDLNPPCDSGEEQAPASRNYLAWRMRVETTPQFDPRSLTTFQEADFRVLGPDGALIPDVRGNAYTCLDEPTDLGNVRLGPGQEYTGWLVVDVPVDSGTLVYAPGGESTGWEWAWEF